jgi:hypothetical protein
MKAFVHQLGFLYCDELVKLHGSRALAVNMLACAGVLTYALCHKV